MGIFRPACPCGPGGSLSFPLWARGHAGPRHSLGLVWRAGLVDQLELGCEAVGAGVLQQATHGVGVQVPDELADPPDLAGQPRLQVIEGLCARVPGLKGGQCTRRNCEHGGG